MSLIPDHIPIIDVRSPAEYEHAHIPGALSLPLFSNEERAVVGTIYKQKGKTKAVQQGLEFVGPKMVDFTRFALKLKSEEIFIYCWRGGMRSSSMAWLLGTVGLKCHRLEGGYKQYRNYVLDIFARQYDIKLLGGYTGSGKTDLLKELAEKGQPVIDLEGLANHKGSAFGAIGENPQPSTEQFENNLAKELLKINPSKPLWLEDESRNIGRVTLPQSLWDQMRNSPVIQVETSFNVRVERLVRDYGDAPIDLLVQTIRKIEKRLGFDNCKNAIEACMAGDIAKAAEICLFYYDKAYEKQLVDRKREYNIDIRPMSFEQIRNISTFVG